MSKREKEKEAIKNGESMDIFIDTRLINKDYSENYDITKGYKFLKTLEEFKDAEDDLEEKTNELRNEIKTMFWDNTEYEKSLKLKKT